MELSELLNTGRDVKITIAKGNNVTLTVRKLTLADMPQAESMIDDVSGAENVMQAIQMLVVKRLDEVAEFIGKVATIKHAKAPDASTSEIVKLLPLEVVVQIISEVIKENTDFFTRLSQETAQVTKALVGDESGSA